MMDPKRLFDCLELHLEQNLLPDMLAAKENGVWKTYSTTEIGDIILHALSTGLLRLGIPARMTGASEGIDKVAGHFQESSRNGSCWIWRCNGTGAAIGSHLSHHLPFRA